MNRIEAIDAMLDGKVIVDPTTRRLRYKIKNNMFMRSVGVSGWERIVSHEEYLRESCGYTLYEEPKLEDTIRLIINGKTYKAVEE
jgi:hypothetical protein